MSIFHGKMYKGAMRDHREKKYRDAVSRGGTKRAGETWNDRLAREYETAAHERRAARLQEIGAAE